MIQEHERSGDFRPVIPKVTATGYPPRDITAELECAYYEIGEITKERDAAVEMAGALRDERVLLMQEIEHRVYNNLQIVSSLLSLHMNYADRPEARPVLQELKKRIRALALVHRQLYEANNICRLDLAGYVRALLSQVFLFRNIDSRQMELHVEGNEVTVDPDTVIPLGLLLYELAEEVLDRHTHAAGQKLNVAIEGRAGSLVITMGYMPAPADKAGDTPSFSSFRFLLVSLLARQIRASLSITPSETFLVAIRMEKLSIR